MVVNIEASKSGYEYDIRMLTSAFLSEDKINYHDEDTKARIKYDSEGEKSIHIDVFLQDYKIRVKLVDDTNIYEEEVIIDNKKDCEQKTSASLLDNEQKIERNLYKNQLKKIMYKVLSVYTKKELPWGTLTGIRPTKIALDNLEAGKDEEWSIKYMMENYLCSKEKAILAHQIAKKELKILTDIDYKNSYSLYVGIPFCPTTCHYCSFTSYSIKAYEEKVDEYLDALCKEISNTNKLINKKLCSVYIGGGTPTSLSPEQLKRLIINIRQNFDMTNVREFTVEAGRPDSITREKLEVLKQFGVTRISINPQTMKEQTLGLIGRKHSVDDIKKAYKLAREIGHDNINMDIILGLPGEDIDDVKLTLEEINKLAPDSLTVHTLAIKRAAIMNLQKEKYIELLPEHVRDMVELSMNYAKEHEYIPYYMYRQKNVTDNLENVGYAKVGKESIYNVLIMEEKQTILALGAGAVCKFVDYDKKKLTRVDNVKSVKDYCERIDEMIKKKKDFCVKF